MIVVAQKPMDSFPSAFFIVRCKVNAAFFSVFYGDVPISLRNVCPIFVFRRAPFTTLKLADSALRLGQAGKFITITWVPHASKRREVPTGVGCTIQYQTRVLGLHAQCRGNGLCGHLYLNGIEAFR